MFGALKKESDSIAFERGSSVTLGLAEIIRIRESEQLESTDSELRLNFIVRDYLSQWCRDNIKGRWELLRDIRMEPGVNSEDVLIFKFTNRREAVRFKLTWGGQ